MIVPMQKVYLVGRKTDHDQLLDALGRLGVMHLVPIDPAQAVVDEQTAQAIDHAERAIQILSPLMPAENAPDLSAEAAIEETIELYHESTEAHTHLDVLHRQIAEMAPWGDVRRDQFDRLRDDGFQITFAVVPVKDLHLVEADLVQPIGKRFSRSQWVAALSRDGEITLPPSATIEPIPPRDRPSLTAEAKVVDERLRAINARLSELAHTLGAIHHYSNHLATDAQTIVASRGAMVGQNLLALQGWAPADETDQLVSKLADCGLDVAVETREATEDETPPTLIRYPRWAQPIKGLFDVLGTVVGYDEFDIGGAFMLALPIFAAMLIGDGGYGAVMLLGLGLGYKKIAPKLGRQFTQLLIIVGATTLIWGFLSGSFFGTTVFKNPVIPVNMTQQSRDMIMTLSFYIGAIHLSLAQLWQAMRLFPNIQFLNKVGWAGFIWGMLGVVQWLVLRQASPFAPLNAYAFLLMGGGVLAIVFAHPSRNLPKMLGLGIASFPLAGISAFSDVTSYVRLMAVGLASGVLATSFTNLALGIKFLPATILVLILGHTLNFALCLIALFAHGVRLNMLEFCNNLGMQWTGYAYQPFTSYRRQEIRA